LENKNKLLKLTKSRIGYIAGLFDGEGCISIQKRRTNGGRDYQYLLRTSLTNADPRAPKILKDYFGANSYYIVKYKNRKQFYYRWVLTELNALNFLIKVSSQFELKKEEAIVALEYMKTLHKNYSRYNKVPLKVWKLRDKLFLKMRALKKNRNTRGAFYE